jgi:cell division protein FtsW (lipid II flippase)
MITLFSAFIATVITIPFIGFVLIYTVTYKVTEEKKRAVKLAADGTTLLFMLSVYFISFEIWQRSLLWLLLIVVLVIAIAVSFLHRKLYDDIELKKLIKGIWRINFILFFLVYIALFTYGLTVKIISAIA